MQAISTKTIWFGLVAATLCSLAFVFAAIWELAQSEAQKRKKLIEMTQGFTAVYSELRVPEAPIPATFRRRGLEHFAGREDDQQAHVRSRMRVVGLPGLEIETREDNVRLRAAVLAFLDDPTSVGVDELRIEDSGLIGRTLVPSIATDQNCATCHNALLGSDVFEMGDVLGAFVVETDLTESAIRTAKYALGVFGVTFVGSALLVRRERRRAQTRVETLQGLVRAEKDKRAAEAHAHFLASHDTLTGLANRGMFLDALGEKLRQARRDGILILFDLDDFKRINDTLGHDAGDALLKSVGERLETFSIQNHGLAARLGGDEFAMLLPLPTGTGATAMCAPLMDALRQPVRHGDRVIEPRCSLGVLTLADAPDPTSDGVMKAADAALYAAKGAGKNVIRQFDSVVRAQMDRQRRLGDWLPTALQQGAITAALQPKVRLSDGRLQGFEALARWDHEGEDIPPTEFIPIAEQNGLVRAIDLAILRDALTFATEAKRICGHLVPISANLSALSFSGPDFVEDIADILMARGYPGDLLTLEITETVLVRDWDHVVRTVAPLRALGVRIALDDFGTGYSSLSYLRRFDFDEVKIDRSFVTDVTGDHAAMVLFESIVAMTRKLGKTVVVEGIETPEQCALVAGRGAHLGQGFLFAKALTKAQACDFLARDVEGRTDTA